MSCLAARRTASHQRDGLYYNKSISLAQMQQLELAQMEHRDANLAALAALGPRKRKPLEASGSGTNQVLTTSVCP